MGERDDELEQFFDAGRGRDALSDDFLARLEADAAAELPAPKVVAFRPRARRLWTGGGLLAAGVAGIAIGLAAPETLNGLILDDAEAFELAAFLPGADPVGLFGDLE